MSRKKGFYGLLKILKIGLDTMAYKKKIYKFRNAIEIEEFHTARYGAPGQKRAKKKKATPEQIEKRNQYNKEKLARHRLREYFKVNDYFSTLTYRREERPEEMDQAKQHFSKFIRKVRKEYRKRGFELRWLRNIEVGTKNGWHIHIVINRIPDTDLILAGAWEKGSVKNTLIYEKGEFRELAAYITKTPRTDSRLRETSYSSSKNLPLPEPEEKTYSYWKTWKEIKIQEGFYLDEDSFHEGVNPVTGYTYRVYTLLRIQRE